MYTHLVGPVESHDGTLMLRIPLAIGGDQFIEVLHDAARVKTDHLLIALPASLGFAMGMLVEISRTATEFTIRPASETAESNRHAGVDQTAPQVWRQAGRANRLRTGNFGFAFAPLD